MNKFKFKPEAFFEHLNGKPVSHYCFDIAEAANAILDNHLESLPKVYSKRMPKNTEPYSLIWSEYESDDSAVGYRSLGEAAVLFNLEQIEKKECSHENVRVFTDKLSPSTLAVCSCGAQLKAKWELA